MTQCKICVETNSSSKTIKSVTDYINALDTGKKWNTLSLKYYFYKTSDPVPTDNYTRINWTDTQKENYRKAIAAWSSISALSLTETTTLNLADIKLILLNDNSYPYLGHAYFPEGSSAGENYISYNNATNKDFPVGSYDYITMVHEMGHTLGLAHPHDNGGTSTTFPGVNTWSDLGTGAQNQTVYTVMSYNDLTGPITPNQVQSYGFIGGPMAYDIEVMVRKYGNTSKNTGNNTYNIPTGSNPYFQTIKDTGGNDTISASGSNKSVTINLTPATLNGNGGVLSRAAGVYGGFTIAKGTNIENAIGGNKGDIIIGNNGRNVIRGNGGNDIIYTGKGKDVVYGGSGNDRIFTKGTGNRVYGGRGADRIVARGRDNIAIGGSGNDTFIPGKGKNVFKGGRGIDKVIFRAQRKNFKIIYKGKRVYHIKPKTSRLRNRFGWLTVLKSISFIQFKDRRVWLT